MFCDDSRTTAHSIADVARATQTTTLDLIDAIDGTVDSMVGMAQLMSGFDRILLGRLNAIPSIAPQTGDYLDPDDEAIDALGQTASGLKDYLARLVKKRSAIDRDARLKNHHCEALHDAYAQATGALAELIDTVENLQAALISHDLAAEPRDGAPYASLAPLIADLRQQ